MLNMGPFKKANELTKAEIERLNWYMNKQKGISLLG